MFRRVRQTMIAATMAGLLGATALAATVKPAQTVLQLDRTVGEPVDGVRRLAALRL